MKIRIILALLILILQPAQAAPPIPLLWQASDGDNSVYLLGSFHFLTPDDYPLAAPVDTAFEDAETVYFEISPEEMNDPDQAQKMFSTGLLKEGNTLRQIVNREVGNQLEKYCSANGIPAESFNAYKPWLAGLIISIAEMQKYGLQGEFGLDPYLMGQAEKTDKQTGGLETENPILQIFQHHIFPRLPEITIKRPEKFGGVRSFTTYQDLEVAYGKGEVHPLDLKKSCGECLVEIFEPVREYIK